METVIPIFFSVTGRPMSLCSAAELGLGLGLSRDCEVTSQGGVKCKERMQSDLHDECCAGRRESLSLGVGPHRATPVEEEQFLIDQVCESHKIPVLRLAAAQTLTRNHHRPRITTKRWRACTCRVCRHRESQAGFLGHVGLADCLGRKRWAFSSVRSPTRWMRLRSCLFRMSCQYCKEILRTGSLRPSVPPCLGVC